MSEKFHFALFLNLTRVLFPRWNFFDRIAHSFEIEIKIAESSSWQKLEVVCERPLWGLFFNPQVNLTLAQNNIIEHFAADVQEIQSPDGMLESKKVKALTSYKLLSAVIYNQLEKQELLSYPVQFKIVANGEEKISDLFISDWISWGRK